MFCGSAEIVLQGSVIDALPDASMTIFSVEEVDIRKL